jgi:TonB-dependent receptor
LLSCAGFAQSGKGSIKGKVTDPVGGVLQGAQVTLKPGGSATATDAQGEYGFTGLAAGDYTVIVNYVGFKVLNNDINLSVGQNARSDAKLELASQSDAIVVTADRPHAEAEAMNRERTADNIVQTLPAEVITSLPNANIADAVGRLPSVTLDRDEGEGKYVQIRGTEPRLVNVTINGINVPSPEGAVRQVNLATIPADLVESIEVNKTLQADMDGDGIGGSVNLVTRTAGEEPTINLNGMAGATPIEDGRTAEQISGTIGQRFGTQKKLGVLFGGSWDYNGRGIDDIEPTPDAVLNNGVVTRVYDNNQMREYKYDRYRTGFAGSLDYRISDDSSVYLRGLYSNFMDYGAKWYYELQNGAAPKYYTSQKSPDFVIGSLLGGGKHFFGTSWIAWDVSAAQSMQTAAAGNPKADFRPNSTLKADVCSYSPTLTTNPYEPQFSCPLDQSVLYNPANWNLKDLIESKGNTGQLNLQATMAMAKNYTFGHHFGTFEFGGKLRNEHKYQNAEFTYWDPKTTLTMSQFQGNFVNSHYYGGAYQFGPVSDYTQIVKFQQQNPGDFTYDSSDSHLNSDPANFDYVDRVGAGFLMNTLDFGWVRLTTGLRFESTTLNLLGYHTTNDANGNWVSTSPVNNNASYTNILPSADVRFRLATDSDLRLVYGRGIARPNPYDMVPYGTEDDQGTSVTIGNPNLKPEFANNYDILFERYLRPFGKFSAGYFYKDLRAPIYQVATTLASGEYAGYTQYQLQNGTTASLQGFEVSYTQHLSFLPGKLRGLGMLANYSWTTSQANGIPGRSDTPALQRQAPNTWNLMPSYDYGRFSLRCGVTYNGAQIYAYQYQDGAAFGIKGPNGDQYVYGHMQVDAQGSIRLSPQFSIVAYGLNLTNAPFGYYEGSTQYMMQREFYGPTIGGGFRWNPGMKD